MQARPAARGTSGGRALVPARQQRLRKEAAGRRSGMRVVERAWRVWAVMHVAAHAPLAGPLPFTSTRSNPPARIPGTSAAAVTATRCRCVRHVHEVRCMHSVSHACGGYRAICMRSPVATAVQGG